MQSNKLSSVKTRRSYSSNDPPSSSTVQTAATAFRKPLMRRPQQLAPLAEEQQQKQQFLGELKSGEFISNSTVTESGEVVSISEFIIAPTTSSQLFEKKRRSFSLNAPVGATGAGARAGTGTSSSKATDSNMKQYMNETSKWRVLRTQLKLPPEVRLKIEKQKPTFKNAALSVLQDVVSRSGSDKLSRPKTRYEPTYQLTPKKHFNRIEAEKVMQNILGAFVSNLDASSSSPHETMTYIRNSMEHLTTLIKARVKSITDHRYKVVVYAIVIDREYQGVMVAAKCLWDVDNDVCITVREDFKNYTIIVSLYAVYHE